MICCTPTFQFSTSGRRAPFGCIQEVDPPLAKVGSKNGPCGTGGKPIAQLKAGFTPPFKLETVAWVKYPCWLRKIAGPALVSYIMPNAARNTVFGLYAYARPMRGPKPPFHESANWSLPLRPEPEPAKTKAPKLPPAPGLARVGSKFARRSSLSVMGGSYSQRNPTVSVRFGRSFQRSCT